MKLTPLSLLATIYPGVAIIGQYPLAVVGDMPVSLERMVMVVLGPLCVLELALGVRNQRVASLVPRGVLVGLGLWLAGITLCLVAQPGWVEFVLFLGYLQKIALGALFMYAVSTEAALRRATLSFVITTTVVSFFTFYVWLTQGSAYVRNAGFGDVESVTIIEGLARSGAIGSVPLMGAWMLATFSRRPLMMARWYVAVAILLGSALLALRREYIISIALCFAWGVVSMQGGLRRIITAMAAVCLVVGGYILVTAVPEWGDRLMGETVEAFSRGQDPRMLMLTTAPSVFAQSPLFGHGIGSFPQLMAKNLPLHFAEMESLNQFAARGLASHNSFLTAGLEFGILGFVGMVVLFSSLGAWCWKLWWSSRGTRRPFSTFAPLFFIQIFFGVFFQDGMSNNMIWNFLGLLVALIVVERTALAYPRGIPRPGPWRGPRPLPNAPALVPRLPAKH